ncbi:transcriptional regulator, TetR family [Sulfobacillus thermosulfidooxidans DSM 9293]|uniref:Transcriptional regulator, TetR family n=1 Tax=Sulfobacillus thermosulfidooxidans (strain DSM 9293 / VKM B-1269 / AT-1) TaxID=929705 RepID=A0A1W1WGD9_SULTA|nr:recombinase family protein [Sulfobacillus thermosulfidooxidans]SMC05368.1 transcriptional regulator, TetR family [Sulfobacillus thermosulfidooxidans DSM 9293]
MIYGYARVSSTTQHLDAQLAQLQSFGCEKIYQEKTSGRTLTHRTQLAALLDTVGSGDVLVVTKLDRFARSTQDALTTIGQLTDKGVSLVVLNMGGDVVDTRTAVGKLLITLLAGIAEFEADMIKERQIEGIAAAKARGVYQGRPRTYTRHHKGLAHALELFEARDTNHLTVNDICAMTQISRATLYRAARQTVHDTHEPIR